MNLRRNKIILISISAFVLIVVLFLVFKNKPLNRSVKVSYVDSEEIRLVSIKDIEDIVYKIYPKFLALEQAEIDVLRIETEIEKIPAIKNAEVYKNYSGVLGIDIELRIPLVKVFDSNNNAFYIGKDGNLFPLSPHKSARVVIANGNIDFVYKNSIINIKADSAINLTLHTIFKLASAIDNDKFLKSQITQIYYNKEKEFELVPRVGRHIVYLGKDENIEKKLHYLKHFYINVLNKEGWNQYSEIDLKFNNQIICRKY